MHFRKQMTLVIMMTVFSTVAFSQKYKGDNWENIKPGATGTLTVVYIEQYGLIYKDRSGNMKGVCVDILSDFAKYAKEKYGKTVVIKYAGEEPDFATFLSIAQKTPGILGVTNTTITEERKKIFKFSPPFMMNRLVILTHNSAPSVSALNELPVKLAGYSAQAIAGSLHVDYIQKIKAHYMPSLNIKFETTGRDIIKNITADRKLFTVIDMTEFIEAVHNKLPVKSHPVNVGIVEELGFIMSKQSDWDVLLKEFITPEYRNSTRYRQIITENLSASFVALVK
jgi:ABC-type amino acid transport substrate-binding protein